MSTILWGASVLIAIGWMILDIQPSYGSIAFSLISIVFLVTGD